MEIKEYKEYKAEEIRRLYTEVGWKAYTDNTDKTVSFYKSLGFAEFSEIDCCGFMRGY